MNCRWHLRCIVLGLLVVGGLSAWATACSDVAVGANDNDNDNDNNDNHLCGNSVLEDSEACDDGNQIDNDGCSSNCELEAPRWRKLTPLHSPPARAGAAMAYDSHRERLVMFGGFSDATALGDTWEFDGSEWMEVTTPNSPPPRAACELSYDEARHRMVLFGGFHGLNDAFHDTWEYDGSTWREINTQDPPPPVLGHAMAYHADLAMTVLALVVGGADSSYNTEIWVYPTGATGTWTRLHGTMGPRAGLLAKMAYDTHRSTVVLFGGYWSGGPGMAETLADTWEFDGQQWALIETATAAPPRMGHAMAFDSARGVTVSFGGDPALFDCLSTTAEQSTWEYDGTDWREISTTMAPSPRCIPAMAYHEALGEMVLFGGGIDKPAASDEWESYRDTWIYR